MFYKLRVCLELFQGAAAKGIYDTYELFAFDGGLGDSQLKLLKRAVLMVYCRAWKGEIVVDSVDVFVLTPTHFTVSETREFHD